MVFDSTLRRFVLSRKGGIVIGLWVLLVVAVVVVQYLFWSPMKFESSRWKTERSQRYRMAKDLRESGKLLGLDEHELQEQLGPADNSVDDARGVHYVLYWLSRWGVDDLWLELALNNGRVVSVNERPD